MKSNLELLDGIKRVDAPPFLLTRIKQKIENSNYNKFSFKFAFSLGLSFIILLILNATIILTQKETQKNDNLDVYSFELITNNSLYNE